MTTFLASGPGRNVVPAVVAALLLYGSVVGVRAAAADLQPVAGEPARTLANVASQTAERPGRLPASIPLRRDAEGRSGQADTAWWLVGLGALGVAVLLAVSGPLRRRWRRAAAAPRVGLPTWQRLLGAASEREVVVLSATRLTARNSVHVIEWRGRQLLIGCSDQSTVLLADLVVPLEVDAAHDRAAAAPMGVGDVP